jgi:hypothetical protein
MKSLIALAVFALTASPAWAQLSGPPAGGPTGQFLGPPSGNTATFLGAWTLTWDGPVDSHCPCRGTLTISANRNGDLEGVWKSNDHHHCPELKRSFASTKVRQTNSSGRLLQSAQPSRA